MSKLLPLFKEWSDEIGPLFMQLIKFNRFKNIVEIGVAHGTTTTYLCKGAAENNGFVYGFDIWNTFDVGVYKIETYTNMEKVKKYLANNKISNCKLYKINTFSDD